MYICICILKDMCPKIYTKLSSLKIGQLKFYTTGFLGYSMVSMFCQHHIPELEMQWLTIKTTVFCRFSSLVECGCCREKQDYRLPRRTLTGTGFL